jgi:hypothetical protein
MKASDWISVKDRLPRVNTGALVCCQEGDEQWIEFATLKRDYFKQLIWKDACDIDLTTVTHWQKFVFPKKEKL